MLCVLRTALLALAITAAVPAVAQDDQTDILNSVLARNPGATKDAGDVLNALRGLKIQPSSDGVGANGIDIGSYMGANVADPDASKSRGELPQLVVFVSASMPVDSLRAIASDVSKAGGVAVLRGLIHDSMAETRAFFQTVLTRDQRHAGFMIDPRLFKQFGIEVTPTVVVAAAPFRPCDPSGPGCDPTPEYDHVQGDITLRKALEFVRDEGTAGKSFAAEHVKFLGAAE